ncbi:hypothetical protein A2424_01120 [Candidatus Peribacteria bacterium RIFOXYC1_FULL_54_13]|nr:MAG: hypothetical protein A2217_06895 [Candidatus Peribacteria bacterium RIFOXYA2_FULL_55_28]OGJ76165.1 MAG: hypothetical protein A2327_04635 [Candidatus Peribacteria bacterium RIFOXYB2_FULL_54_17]OGJ79625.1 MAG: hypothetical protein A2424_01120 [Candidatus Peribacteria bacterium RIFOXYC1_FULL_54_13]OGJ82894.1 MAG: hypothetical protein A2598_06020 [Candidatus Peribacteria bacterium RIFOXYD1_FULL_54_13]
MTKAEQVGSGEQLPEAAPGGVEGAADPRVVTEVSDALREHGATLGLSAADFRRVSPGVGADGQPLERRSMFGE